MRGDLLRGLGKCLGASDYVWRTRRAQILYCFCFFVYGLDSMRVWWNLAVVRVSGAVRPFVAAIGARGVDFGVL
jgi:hypothetical protein